MFIFSSYHIHTYQVYLAWICSKSCEIFATISSSCIIMYGCDIETHAASLTCCSAASFVYNLAHSMIATGDLVDFHGTAIDELEAGEVVLAVD